MSVAAATSTRMAFTVGSTTASIGVFPRSHSSFSRLKDGCRVALEEAARASRRANGGFYFTSISPSCKIRSRNSSANQRRAQGRKVRERPSPEINTPQGEDEGEGPTTAQDNQIQLRQEKEILPVEEDSSGFTQATGGSATTLNGDEEYMEGAGNGPFAGSPLEIGPAPGKARGSPGVSVNDLMVMVKEAESNIMILNQVRGRAIEELQAARIERDDLQSQVQILKARLSDSEAKLKSTVEAKEKAMLLEEEVGTLKAQLAQKGKDGQVVTKLREDLGTLQAHAKDLAALNKSSGTKGSELKRLEAQNQNLQDEINTLRVQLADSRAEIATFSRGVERDKAGLPEYVKGLESKLVALENQLAEVQANSAEFRTVSEEGLALQEEVGALRVQLAGVSGGSAVARPELVAKNQELQSQVDELRAKLNSESAYTSANSESDADVKSLRDQVDSLSKALARADAERKALSKVRGENLKLQEQVQVLEQRLRESDAEIRTQLKLYLAEVEAFQANLKGLKAENQNGFVQVPVGEMPWDFWSGLLLRIDVLMLGDLITQEDAKELQLMTWRREQRLRDAYLDLEDEADEDLVAGFLELINPHKRPGIYVVHIAAEMAPVAKVGGLGDVLTGLSRSLQKKGHLVEAILPKYDCMDYSRIKGLKELDLELHSFFDGHIHKNKVWSAIVEGLPVYFIEPLHSAKFFWRGQFYSEPDDFRRFTYFCRAALEFLLQSGKRPDIIHSHDWQTAVVAPLYWDIYVPLGLDSARLAFTCHNFEYQGAEAAGALAACGLSVRDLLRPDRMQDNLYPNKINLLKGGVVFSNVVTTVSPTYAKEVLKPEGGKGLHGTLGVHSQKFFGILNGIDEEAWNPATDSLIEYQYSADDLNGKAVNKQKLRQSLGLGCQGDDVGRPLVGCVTRLVPQKGVHLIRHAIYRTLERGGQFILLGSSPVPQIQSEFEGIARQFENHLQVRLVLKYDEVLSHSIYAASDLFVIPSIFEPCGLTQMIAMRYGSIPVVRKTGGLADSVFDADDDNNPMEKRNGFVFDSTDEAALNWALDRALDYYMQNPEWWQNMVRKAMQIDFSWDSSAEQYVDLYKQVIAKARTRV